MSILSYLGGARDLEFVGHASKPINNHGLSDYFPCWKTLI